MKRLLFGFLAVAIAVSASAFKNANSIASTQVYVQSSSGAYVLLTGNYNPALCIPNPNFCGYVTTSTGYTYFVTNGNPFISANVSSYVSLGYLTPISTAKGWYYLP